MEVIEILSASECCVCDLTKSTGHAQSRISFHLKVLKDSGLITDRQSGRWVYYKLNLDSLRALQNWTSQLISDCQQLSEACD